MAAVQPSSACVVHPGGLIMCLIMIFIHKLHRKWLDTSGK